MTNFKGHNNIEEETICFDHINIAHDDKQFNNMYIGGMTHSAKIF